MQVAGSAEAFRKVDLVYVEKAAKAAKAAGVQHFSLLTAQMANSKQWANDMLPFHPLLYIKTKGQVSAEAPVYPQLITFISVCSPSERSIAIAFIAQMLLCNASGRAMLDAHGRTPPLHAILGRISIVCCPCERAQWDVGLHSERAALHEKSPAQEDRLGRCNHLHRAAWDPMAAEHQRLSTDVCTGRGRRTSSGLP